MKFEKSFVVRAWDEATRQKAIDYWLPRGIRFSQETGRVLLGKRGGRLEQLFSYDVSNIPAQFVLMVSEQNEVYCALDVKVTPTEISQAGYASLNLEMELFETFLLQDAEETLKWRDLMVDPYNAALVRTLLNEDYPVVNVEEVVETRGPEFRPIVPEISPRYFSSNPRFRSLGQVSSPKLVDYMDVYEEGERWTLTIVEATIDNETKYLFLPLASAIPPDPRRSEYGKPAFGIETNSFDYGKRRWQVFDAFADDHFLRKLCDLFFPWVGVQEGQVNAYTDITESGIGNFTFHTKHELAEPLYSSGMEVELVESGFRLKSDDNDLIIYQTLPAIDEIKLLDDTPAVAGWIDYSGEQDLHLLIGILYGAAKPDSF